MAFEIILLGTSPTPMGRTPGHLFNGTSLQATNALIPSELTTDVQIRLPTPARDEHRLFDADLKDVHMRFHIVASRPEGPAEPLVLNALSLMDEASSDSKIKFTAVLDDSG